LFGSQCFSFLPTKDHFSSNWTSRVWGGKSHDLVVDLPGVLAGDDGQADHGVLVDADEAAGLTHATTLLEVLQDGQGFVVGELAAVQGGALAFAETVLAGAAGEDAPLLVGAITEADTQVVKAALAVVGALGVLTAEDFQVVHGVSRRQRHQKKVALPLQSA
jgi:hypothetical protein